MPYNHWSTIQKALSISLQMGRIKKKTFNRIDIQKVICTWRTWDRISSSDWTEVARGTEVVGRYSAADISHIRAVISLCTFTSWRQHTLKIAVIPSITWPAVKFWRSSSLVSHGSSGASFSSDCACKQQLRVEHVISVFPFYSAELIFNFSTL